MLSHRISADSTSLVCADLFLGTHSRDSVPQVQVAQSRAQPIRSGLQLAVQNCALPGLPHGSDIVRPEKQTHLSSDHNNKVLDLLGVQNLIAPYKLSLHLGYTLQLEP
ncbi:uncharacterized protein MEPE_02313 [Melanopsichium pennsylvanicum]|uniref:Uncharacterized protein n=1 Tax=Melanopsichium pennsylvanicum TaxID=63383 RepID=A0AAJ4XKS9_9BASI|nr:uncharacterized protein MEPE_02313 [Melanopsichium pennsylvanicum]